MFDDTRINGIDRIIDITNLEEKKEKRECVWALDVQHSGLVEIEKMFGGCVEVPICEHHFVWHKMICALVRKGKLEVEGVVNMSYDECCRKMMVRGLIPTWW